MEKLREVLEAHKEEYIQYLADLISIDTHDIGHGIKGGLEKKGQEYLVELLGKMGCDQIIEDPLEEEIIEACLEQHQEGNLGHDLTDRYNVYATFKGNGGKSLLFNSHMDVMPADKSEGWTDDPFTAVVRDGRIYGRGSADMKGGLMASVLAVKLLQDAGVELPGDVTITSVCDEEGGGNGSMQTVMRGITADAAVNCEGSSDELILAHMGWVFFKVDFEGRSCHSGGKKNGVSAIDKAIKVIQALNEKEHDWLLEYKHPLLPPPNLNIGVIQGGTAGSTVPGDCSFSTCVHFIPNQMSHDQVVEEFTEVVRRVTVSDPWLEEHPPKITMYQAGNGYEQDPSDPFVQTFMSSYEEALGRKVKIVGSPSGCDARLFRNIADIPTIEFGPGNLSEFHGVDEWLDLNIYLETILIYAHTILNWCGGKES